MPEDEYFPETVMIFSRLVKSLVGEQWIAVFGSETFTSGFREHYALPTYHICAFRPLLAKVCDLKRVVCKSLTFKELLSASRRLADSTLRIRDAGERKGVLGNTSRQRGVYIRQKNM